MTTPSLFEEGDAVRIKRTVEAPYGDRVGVVKDVHRHDGVLVELGSELASWRFLPAQLTHTAPNNVPDDVWRMIKPPEEPARIYDDSEDDYIVSTLVVKVRVPNEDLGQIDFHDTVDVLDYLAERHADLEIECPNCEESNQ